MTPPVSDRLFSEPSMQFVESHGESLRSVVPLLFIKWPLIEERDLLGIGHQTGHAHGHAAEPHPTTEGPLKKRREHGSQIAFPTGFRDGARPLRDFTLIAVADREGQTATHPPLTAKRPTQSLQNIQEPPPQHRIIDFIRLKIDAFFETRLNGGREHGHVVDPLRPSGELSGIVTECEFQCPKRTLGYLTQGEEIEVIESFEDVPHTRSMEPWQGSHRERRHEDTLRPRPDIVQL